MYKRQKLIITIGISGSVQFAAGMRGAECIIAINTARKAPVFDIANIGLVGDWYEILPRLLKTVKELSLIHISRPLWASMWPRTSA